MSFIDKNLLADEQILYRTRKHLIIFTLPALFTLLALGLWFYLYSSPEFEAYRALVYLPALIAFVLWIQTGIAYFNSEFVVTNKRIMMREGLFNRHATDLRLSAIAQLNVNQSLLGQLLNYGELSINAFSVYDSFQTINKPFVFQRYVSQQLDHLVR